MSCGDTTLATKDFSCLLLARLATSSRLRTTGSPGRGTTPSSIRADSRLLGLTSRSRAIIWEEEEDGDADVSPGPCLIGCGCVTAAPIRLKGEPPPSPSDENPMALSKTPPACLLTSVLRAADRIAFVWSESSSDLESSGRRDSRLGQVRPFSSIVALSSSSLHRQMCIPRSASTHLFHLSFMTASRGGRMSTLSSLSSKTLASALLTSFCSSSSTTSFSSV
mmetsp:Transcript_1850/g.4031  ORF Transcript_1850/g.4031 Transcript_1850/m.4031 type:complete len:222 (-) Transcript_1850:1015-1680(-)